MSVGTLRGHGRSPRPRTQRYTPSRVRRHPHPITSPGDTGPAASPVPSVPYVGSTAYAAVIAAASFSANG
jgi:hypothetical protein